jgi:hypothetical protein
VILNENQTKENKIRLSYPEVKYNQMNNYSYYIELPELNSTSICQFSIQTNDSLRVKISQFKVEGLSNLE